MTLNELQLQLADVNLQINTIKRGYNDSKKEFKKLQSCKLNHHNAHKYFDLQRAYLESLKA